MILWFTGLSGSGKTTIATGVQDITGCYILDGDTLREGINNDCDFSEEGRTENIRRAAHIANILHQTNKIVICTFITPLKLQRDLVRGIIGDDDHMIHIKCDALICKERDPKGLYEKMPNDMEDSINMYEEPENADLTISTGLWLESYCVNQVIQYIIEEKC